MRSCSKTRCNEPAAASLALRYDARQVAMYDLLAERDPNLLELCSGHAEALVPPVGWVVQDHRGENDGVEPDATEASPAPSAPWLSRALPVEPGI